MTLDYLAAGCEPIIQKVESRSRLLCPYRSSAYRTPARRPASCRSENPFAPFHTTLFDFSGEGCVVVVVGGWVGHLLLISPAFHLRPIS